MRLAVLKLSRCSKGDFPREKKLVSRHNFPSLTFVILTTILRNTWFNSCKFPWKSQKSKDMRYESKVNELLCNVLRVNNSKKRSARPLSSAPNFKKKNQKNHGNKFEFLTRRKYKHLPLIVMEITFLPFLWTYH